MALVPEESREMISDAKLLESLGLPSLDCLLRRKRLVYLASLLRRPCSAIMSLSASWTTRSAAWSDLVVDDLRALQAAIPDRLAHLGEPAEKWQEWKEFILASKFRWKNLAHGYVALVNDFAPPGIKVANLLDELEVRLVTEVSAPKAAIASNSISLSSKLRKSLRP